MTMVSFSSSQLVPRYTLATINLKPKGDILLTRTPACFHFAVQKQANPVTMPIEDASVIWDEDVSPFHTVATIKIENQDFDNLASLADGERSSFNPWQSLAEHQPLGRMNEVRRLVYANAAKLRNKGVNKNE